MNRRSRGMTLAIGAALVAIGASGAFAGNTSTNTSNNTSTNTSSDPWASNSSANSSSNSSSYRGRMSDYRRDQRIDERGPFGRFELDEHYDERPRYAPYGYAPYGYYEERRRPLPKRYRNAYRERGDD